MDDCTACQGTGEGYAGRACPVCRGKGYTGQLLGMNVIENESIPDDSLEFSSNEEIAIPKKTA